MEKIKTNVARASIKKYEERMRALGVDTPEKGFTKSIGFPRKELQEWIQSLNKTTTEIKIYFGIYPEENFPIDHPPIGQNDSGRFTAILWPYNADEEPAKNDDGDEELPVNIGELTP
ncbi:MAG: hypothetical protein ABIN48_08795 [Ginsengibacter sp.]